MDLFLNMQYSDRAVASIHRAEYKTCYLYIDMFLCYLKVTDGRETRAFNYKKGYYHLPTSTFVTINLFELLYLT